MFLSVLTDSVGSPVVSDADQISFTVKGVVQGSL